MRTTLFLGLTGLLCGGLASAEVPQAAAPDLVRLQAMTARFTPADIRADVTKVPQNEREALVKMIESAEVMDALFLRQV